MGRVTTPHRIIRLDGARRVERPDTLAAEEPLEIRVDGAAVSVTMRTPGDDFDLVAGFLLTEGVIAAASDLAGMRYCADAGENGEGPTYNVVDARLTAGGGPLSTSITRNLLTTSSCGICGKASIDAVRTRTHWPVAEDALEVDASVLSGLPDTLREAQRVFTRTGALHAAGLFDAAGRMRALREDVGRHNAVDKVIGHALREGWLPLRGHLLLVSGRASFELTQKALMAGIPLLAAVSAPSSLAVQLAEESGMTLVGFLRGSSMNVYAGGTRVVTPA